MIERAYHFSKLDKLLAGQTDWLSLIPLKALKISITDGSNLVSRIKLLHKTKGFFDFEGMKVSRADNFLFFMRPQ